MVAIFFQICYSLVLEIENRLKYQLDKYSHCVLSYIIGDRAARIALPECCFSNRASVYAIAVLLKLAAMAEKAKQKFTSVQFPVLLHSKAVTYDERPKMKRDARQKKQSFSQKRTAFLSGFILGLGYLSYVTAIVCTLADLGFF